MILSSVTYCKTSLAREMRLPDNEIRDITKLLEEGKPLPDKYRFMLFGDDREIELRLSG